MFHTVALGSVAVAASASLARWDHELADEAALSRPALSDELIAAVNGDPASTWTAARNMRFEGATLAEAKFLNGELNNTDRSTWLPYRPLKHVEIPEEFDWRTDPRAASCPSVREIRDQANCGSCWAFGTVTAMTDRICIASGGKKNVHLSTQDVTSCNRIPNMGCSGGFTGAVYKYYAKEGIVSGGNYGDESGCWSYKLAPCAHHTHSAKYPDCEGQGRAPACVKECVDNAQLDWNGDKHFGEPGSSTDPFSGGYAICKNQDGTKLCAEKMMQEIYQNGPISAGFTVMESFESYKSGVYQHLPSETKSIGGHAIRVLGYGNENGTPYWLIANSWNEDWGMDGFFKMIRGTNEGDIENPTVNGGPVAGMPKKSDDVIAV